MGVAARDADILELLVRHLQQRKAAAPTFEHAVNLPRDGTEHNHEATDEAAMGQGLGLRANSRASVANCLDCIHFRSALSQLYLSNRRLDMD